MATVFMRAMSTGSGMLVFKNENFLVLFRSYSGRQREKTKQRPSFLKKRSKKLSSIAAGAEFERENSVLSETDKSFLVLAVAACDPLFLEKELLALLPFQWVDLPVRLSAPEAPPISR